MLIKNSKKLLDHGSPRRRELLTIAEKALAAADPYSAAYDFVSINNNALYVADQKYSLKGRRLFVLGVGKASFPIAKALDEILGGHIYQGLVVCKNGQQGTLEHMELRLASHPIPDQSSLESAHAGQMLLAQVEKNDIVVACITGGSSALFVDPVDTVSLSDKAKANQVLLTCGADIREINAVRKAISKVKGGRLIQRLPKGATVINLTVSDVTGDPLEFITDLTVPDVSTLDDARETLDKYQLWERLPTRVTTHLSEGSSASPGAFEQDLSHIKRQDVILVSGDAACTGAASCAEALGITPLILSTQFEGDSSELARAFAAIAREIYTFGRPVHPPCLIIGGGETKVRIGTDENPGKGGPNQAFAVAISQELAGTQNTVALSMDTDGTDGPTDAAGGLVDCETIKSARALKIDLLDALGKHDTYTALEQLGDLILTGNTGTNVNDLKLVLIH